MIQLRIQGYTQDEKELLHMLFTDMSEHCTSAIYADWFSSKAKRRVLRDVLDALSYLEKSTTND